jgi:hypothetical protein
VYRSFDTNNVTTSGREQFASNQVLGIDGYNRDTRAQIQATKCILVAWLKPSSPAYSRGEGRAAELKLG